MRKKQEDKSMVLSRQSELAKKMQEGLGYQKEYEWYSNTYKKSEKSYQHDKTIVYHQWKIDSGREISEKKIDYINSLKTDRQLARDTYQIAAAIQATKLMAQIDGILTKQNESVININNNTLNLEVVTTEELLKAIEKLKK